MKLMKNQIVTLMVFLGIGSIQASAEPFAKGPYLGQTPPGPVAKVFAPGLISDTRPHTWEAWGTFSADGNTFCFNGPPGGICVTENTDQGWTAPKRITTIPPSSACCCLSPDAKSVYFVYSYDPAKRFSLHRCTRTSEGWSLPHEMGPPFSTSRVFGGFSFSADNSMYFWGLAGSDEERDFSVFPFVDNTWLQAVDFLVDPGGRLNGRHPGIAPDESFMVFYSIKPGTRGGTETDLYLTLRKADGTWTKPRNMGPRINSRYHEWGASISPDKKFLFFTRATGWGLDSNSDSADIYWVELKEYLPESYR